MSNRLIILRDINTLLKLILEQNNISLNKEPVKPWITLSTDEDILRYDNDIMVKAINNSISFNGLDDFSEQLVFNLEELSNLNERLQRYTKVRDEELFLRNLSPCDTITS